MMSIHQFTTPVKRHNNDFIASKQHFRVVWVQYLCCCYVLVIFRLSSIVSKNMIYRQTSNIRRTLVGNKIVDHSGAVVSALLQLHLHSLLNT